jgi:hypothetical protein
MKMYLLSLQQVQEPPGGSRTHPKGEKEAGRLQLLQVEPSCRHYLRSGHSWATWSQQIGESAMDLPFIVKEAMLL